MAYNSVFVKSFLSTALGFRKSAGAGLAVDAEGFEQGSQGQGKGVFGCPKRAKPTSWACAMAIAQGKAFTFGAKTSM